MNSRRIPSRGFTIVEILAVVGIIGVGGAMSSVAMNASVGSPAVRQPDTETAKRIKDIRKKLDGIRKQVDEIESDLKEIEGEKPAPLTASLTKARSAARQLKDATQIRGIVQSFVIWSNQNQGTYPLPSKIDTLGMTVAGAPETKDTTANILSMLIYGGHISTELCISPAEANPNIKQADKYELDVPKTAVNPENALWDPAFNADFTGGKTGNVSYAHLQPVGQRLKKWSDTFVSSDAAVGNRGPEIESVTRGEKNDLTVKTKIADSLTYLIHGPRTSWEGNIAYNDGHVSFETVLVNDPNKAWPAYIDKNGKAVGDVLFFDEPDSKEPGGNLYLGIFTKAGKTAEDWTAIWD